VPFAHHQPGPSIHNELWGAENLSVPIENYIYGGFMRKLGVLAIAAALGAALQVQAEETCRLSWGSCRNPTICAEGTHSAGHNCHPTFTGYTYWLFGAPIPTGKKCGCAPPPPPYTERKFDDDGYPISDGIKQQIDEAMKDVDMDAVGKYFAAVDRVQGLLRVNTADHTGVSLPESVQASGCEK